jgi:hypothetical protein
MRDFRDAKAMARSLRHGLTDHGLDLSHSQSLELTAKAFGYDNWNILAAKIEAAQPDLGEAGPSGPKTLFCSFCGKASHDVATLIAGPSVFICNECVGLCDDIVEHSRVLRLMKAGRDDTGDHPQLNAYLAERSDDQIRAYLAGAEGGLARERDYLRLVDEAIALRAEGRRPAARAAGGPRLPAHFDEKTDAEMKAHRAEHAGKLALGIKAVETVTRMLEARA